MKISEGGGRYNWVFFATIFDWYSYMYQEILDNENVRYIKDVDVIFTPLERYLYHNLSSFIKRIILKRALKRITFASDSPICFVYFAHFLSEIKNGMADVAKQIFPNSQHVFFFTDAKHITAHNLLLLRPKMDCIGVYDPIIAKNFKLEFWPNSLPTINSVKTDEMYDLCFVGNGIDRIDKIEKIFELCSKKGLKVAIYLKTSDTNNRIEGVHYIDKLIPYTENIDIVKKSRCVLELKSKTKLCGCSLRVQEAVILNKKILTDNINVYEMPCCKNNPQWISYFNTVSDIDWDFLLNQNEKVDYQYNNEYAAKQFLSNIEMSLANKSELGSGIFM